MNQVAPPAAGYARQLRIQACELAAASCRLDAAVTILTGTGSCEDLAVTATAITALAGRLREPARIPGGVLTGLAAAVHEHIGQADDLIEHALAVLDGALARIENASAAGDVQAAVAADAQLLLCELVIEDAHAAGKRLRDIHHRISHPAGNWAPQPRPRERRTTCPA